MFRRKNSRNNMSNTGKTLEITSCLFSTGTTTSLLLFPPPQAWRSCFQTCFDIWSFLSFFHFVFSSYLEESDLLIEFKIVGLQVANLPGEHTELWGESFKTFLGLFLLLSDQNDHSLLQLPTRTNAYSTQHKAKLLFYFLTCCCCSSPTVSSSSFLSLNLSLWAWGGKYLGMPI